ncbi:MAG: transposase, partial [Clostridiales bacterium]|nr:transposase [Clostridiales bacterium]
AGRGAVKNKLARLQEEQGIKVTYINAAYTSQQCNVCGYIYRANRKDQKHFKCLCCGHTSNADVNAARNIKDRRSILISLDSSNAVVRKNLRERLFDRHILCCPSGRHHAAASKIGLAGSG